MQGRVLSNSSWDYDFRETSSRFQQAVGKTVPRRDFSNSSDYEGASRAFRVQGVGVF